MSRAQMHFLRVRTTSKLRPFRLRPNEPNVTAAAAGRTEIVCYIRKLTYILMFTDGLVCRSLIRNAVRNVVERRHATQVSPDVKKSVINLLEEKSTFCRTKSVFDSHRSCGHVRYPSTGNSQQVSLLKIIGCTGALVLFIECTRGLV